MDTIDWRTQLQPDSRQRIINKIMDTLMEYLLFSRQEGSQELKKIAEIFEEKIYSAATRSLFPPHMMSPMQPQQLGLQQQQNGMQQDMAQRLQASGQNPGLLIEVQKQQLYQAQRGVPPDTSSTSLDSTSWTGHQNGGDWQEEVYQKIKQMKELYLPELSAMYQKILNKLMQEDCLLQQLKSEQLEKVKLFKATLERAMTFLQVPKSSIQPGYKEKLVSYEKQIINFVNANKSRKTVPQMQQQQPPSQFREAMIKIRSKKKSSSLSEPLFRIITA